MRGVGGQCLEAEGGWYVVVVDFSSFPQPQQEEKGQEMQAGSCEKVKRTCTPNGERVCPQPSSSCHSAK